MINRKERNEEGIMADYIDPRYMREDSEITEYNESPDDEGGTLYYEIGPISQVPPGTRRGAYHPPGETRRREEGISQRYGIPRTDIERAMNHYGITEVEYLSHPECYPLPARGARLRN
jgi:hypothetical protein